MMLEIKHILLEESGYILGLIFFSLISILFIAVRESLTIAATRDFELPDDEKKFGLEAAKKIIADINYYNSVCNFVMITSLVCVGYFAGCMTIGVAIVIAIFALIFFSSLMQVLQSFVSLAPEKFLCFFAHFVVFVGMVFRPFVLFIKGVGRIVLSFFKLPLPSIGGTPVSPEDISAMVVRSSEAGEIEEEQGEMIQGVIEFSDSLVREVMTPRKDIVAISEKASLREILALFRKERLSRIVVIGEDLDDVKGILIIKDLLPLLIENESAFDIQKFIRPAHTVLETMKTDELLAEFQERAFHFAVVLDEHGGVAGVVTVEDLVEEIVGEIFDEYDSPEEEVETSETLNGDLVVDGGTLIDDLNSEYEFDFPEGEYDTIAGLVINLLGKIPDCGESVECNGLTIRVEKKEGHRIVLLKIIGVKDFQARQAEEDN